MKKSRSTLLIIALLAIVAFVFYKYRQPRFVAGEQAPDFEVGLLNVPGVNAAQLATDAVQVVYNGQPLTGPCWPR